MLPFYDALAQRFHNLHEQMHKELDTLPEEGLDWTPGPEMNSASVILVHLTGAERYLVGDIVMQDPSNRNREAEFQVRGMTKADLSRRLDESESYIRSALEKLNLEDLSAERMHPRRGEMVSVAWALLHVLDHAGLHLGHLQITTQLWQQHAGKG